MTIGGNSYEQLLMSKGPQFAKILGINIYLDHTKCDPNHLTGYSLTFYNLLGNQSLTRTMKHCLGEHTFGS